MTTSDALQRAKTVRSIAQAKFSTGLRRDDNTPGGIPTAAITVESSAGFSRSLDAVLQRNTTVNVQVSIKMAAPFPNRSRLIFVFRFARFG